VFDDRAEGVVVTDALSSTGYAPVNGMQMYYEVHGHGPPVVLLHGSFYTIELWGEILPALAANHQVVAVEMQGHGRTTDVDRPLKYEQLADDMSALMDFLKLPEADILGYSMGGGVALQLAMRHPERVRKLVLLSAHYRADGYYPESMAAIAAITPELFAGGPLDEIYQRIAPTPDALPRLVEKIKAMEGEDYAWSEADVCAITSPAILIYADSDGMKLEHMIELFQLLGGGVPGDLVPMPDSQLAIIPGANHVSLASERYGDWLPLVERFLTAPTPQAS
jgi:pimeloyl-ACP methyl ester carboxylesterase